MTYKQMETRLGTAIVVILLLTFFVGAFTYKGFPTNDSSYDETTCLTVRC